MKKIPLPKANPPRSRSRFRRASFYQARAGGVAPEPIVEEPTVEFEIDFSPEVFSRLEMSARQSNCSEADYLRFLIIKARRAMRSFAGARVRELRV